MSMKKFLLTLKKLDLIDWVIVGFLFLALFSAGVVIIAPPPKSDASILKVLGREARKVVDEVKEGYNQTDSTKTK